MLYIFLPKDSKSEYLSVNESMSMNIRNLELREKTSLNLPLQSMDNANSLPMKGDTFLYRTYKCAGYTIYKRGG